MLLPKVIKKNAKRIRKWLHQEIPWPITNDSLLLGTMACSQIRAKKAISSLQEVEFKVTSQWGEDGIIDWLIERAAIPSSARSFIEFGVQDYREANTRFLMTNRNWRGLIMDGDPALIKAAADDGLLWAHQLTAKSVFITRENINGLISDAGFSGEIGLLSIDLDGNDYWVWEAIEVVQPIICICEYNAVFGDLHAISVPYDPTFQRRKAHVSDLYFGASIAALRSLAAKKGYRFVGTTRAGNDAFFVREDYASRFVDVSLENIVQLPSHARESRDAEGKLTYVSGIERLRQIEHLPVIDVHTGKSHEIRDLGSAYSVEWLGIMTGSR